ncbi:MAG: hypothetical protein M3Y80_02410, partial [Verrucomicrobiota bacterium]|nr:hypothetical protein [Verrucomicrobiota bacterium]
AVLLLAAIIMGRRKVLVHVGWELLLLVVVLAVCMMPSAGMFRFSFRSLALFHVVLALAAAEAFRAWASDGEPVGGSRSAVTLGGGWAVLLAIGMAMATRIAGGGGEVCFIFQALAAAWWLAARVWLHRDPAQAWLLPLVTFIALLATYLALPMHSAVSRFGFDANLNAVAPLDPDRLYLSIYQDPTEHYRGDQTGGWFGTITRPGSTSMFAGVHLINGYTPVGPAGIARLLDFGTHGHINPPRISDVVLPEAGPDGLLAKLGIDGLLVASDEPLPAPLPPGWRMVHSTWEGEVWHRDTALPHVRALPDEQFGGADITLVENSRQRVRADVKPNDAARPVRIVFSRPYFPGYHATLNGRLLDLNSLNGLAPTVELPAGEGGRLELIYRPRAVTLGSAIVAASLLAAGVWLMVRRRDGISAAPVR